MRINLLITSLICAVLVPLSMQCCRAEDPVFDQPAVEARVNVPDLAQKIDSVVEGRITSVDPKSGVFTFTGRRVAFVASSDNQTNPYMNPPAPVAIAEAPARDCPNGHCGWPTSFSYEDTVPATVIETNGPAEEVPISTSYDPSMEIRESTPLIVDRQPARSYPSTTVVASTPAATIRYGLTDVEAPGWHGDHFYGRPHASGFAPSLNNGTGGAYMPFAFDGLSTSRELHELNRIDTEPIVTGYAPTITTVELEQSMPAHLQHKTCTCTRIVLQAPLGTPGAAANSNQAIRPTRPERPLSDYKFFGPDNNSLVVMNSADFFLPASLQHENVLHPVQNGSEGAPAGDNWCECSGSIVITPNSARFTAKAPAFTDEDLAKNQSFVSYQKEPMETFTGNPNDTIWAIKSLPQGSVGDLKVGDDVLVGYDEGIVDQPQFVIKASR